MPEAWRAVAGAVAGATIPVRAADGSLPHEPLATWLLMGLAVFSGTWSWGWLIACGRQDSTGVLAIAGCGCQQFELHGWGDLIARLRTVIGCWFRRIRFCNCSELMGSLVGNPSFTAKAGTQKVYAPATMSTGRIFWIPAFAGMTALALGRHLKREQLPTFSLRAERGNLGGARVVAMATGLPRRCAPRNDFSDQTGQA